MTRFLSRRQAPGVGLLALGALTVVLSIPSPARAAPGREAADAKMDRGILVAIDEVAGLIARTNEKDRSAPGLDRALRALVSALTHQHHHKHHHHHRHHRHEGFGAGLQGGKGNLDMRGVGGKDGKGEERKTDGKGEGRGERGAGEGRDKGRRGEGGPGERVGRNLKGRQEGERGAGVEGKPASPREGLKREPTDSGKQPLWRRDAIKDVFTGGKGPGDRVGKSTRTAKDGAATVARGGGADKKGKQTFKKAEAPARQGKEAAGNARAASSPRAGAKGGQTKQALGKGKSAAPASGVAAAGRGPGPSAQRGGAATRTAPSPAFSGGRGQTGPAGRGKAYQPTAASAARGKTRR